MNKKVGFSLSSPFKIHIRRGLAFGIIIVGALIAFEVFNYSTTEYALSDLLGDLGFLGIHWSTILAIAFCGIDFAGIARLFTPEEGDDEPSEVWYLFGAWLLAATMNAMLTWWGVSQAILDNANLSSGVIPQQTIVRVVPIFVAILVWLIRVFIIGTFSVAGDRLFSQRDKMNSYAPYIPKNSDLIPVNNNRRSAPFQVQKTPSTVNTFHPAPKTNTQPDPAYSRAEPTYQQVSMSSPSQKNNTASSQTLRSFSGKTGSNNSHS
jgi:hypothetical protein